MAHGYDIRIVSYEQIHSIKPDDWAKLIEAIDPKPNETILDAMCGYGAVGKGILEKENAVNLFLLDKSEVQIKRARENLPKLAKDHFVVESLHKSNYENEFFDKVVIKMGLHEVSKNEQLKISKEVFRILKPNGKLVIWNIMFNGENQMLFQDIIRKKDELAGFEMLIRKRYFFREDEFLETMKKANFTKIKEFHTIDYRFSSKKILESELHNDKEKLRYLNEFIRKRFPKILRKSLKFQEHKEDIQFNVPCKIFVMTK